MSETGMTGVIEVRGLYVSYLGDDDVPHDVAQDITQDSAPSHRDHRDHSRGARRPGGSAVPSGTPPAVLSEVDLSVSRAETVLLTGASGSGKTTLLRCLNGLVPGFFEAHVRGTVTIGGAPVTSCSTRDLAWRVGMVFQDPRSEFFTLDVTSELAFSCENYALPARQVATRVETVARRLGITHLLGRRIHGLSSGERQMVAIGAALVLEPEVLLLDEPSANLDSQGLAVLGEAITSLRDQGVTVVVTDHRIAYLAGLVDRCVVLREGRVAAELSGEQLRRQPPRWFTEQGLRQPRQPQAEHTTPGPVGSDPRHRPGLRVVGAEVSLPGAGPLWRVDELVLPATGVVGVTGANGVGKTTFMRVLLGLLRSRGHVTWEGRRWSRRSRRHSCALVTQDVEYQLVGETLTQELLIGAPPGPRTRARAEELLDRTGLSELAHRHPLTLSGGQKQRLGVALACMKQARVVVLDEPTSGLDAASMRLVSRLLTGLADSGALVLVITHDQEFARLTFDHCLHIEDSRVTYRKLLWKEQV